MKVFDETMNDDSEDEITIDCDASYPDGVGIELEEKRRAFLVRYYASPDIDVGVTTRALVVLTHFLKTGEAPPATVTNLSSVKDPT